MIILWLSWRDIKNPDAGGAEKVAIEISSRFVKEGHKVTIFTSKFKGAEPLIKHRGVTIIRKGNRLTCRLYAFFYFLKAKNIDLVIDEINTIPFFTPLYARKNSIALIHQLAREYWFSQVIWPLNLIGFLLEPVYLRLYRKTPTLAISNSTESDLVKLGFEKIQVIRIGLDFQPRLITEKQNKIIFIGRLTKVKNPAHVIEAFKLIHEEIPNLKLFMVGRGKSTVEKSLKNLIQVYKLEKSVKLTGFVSQTAKLDLLRKAKVVLIPSIREGWSLVASEAAALGCIPIGYNVPGLKDSIINGQTGLLSKPNAQALAKTALLLLNNEQLRMKLTKTGYQRSKKLSWENCYHDFKRIIGKY